MRRFSYLCFGVSLFAALAPAALPAQTITFGQPHAISANTPESSTVNFYADGNYLGKSVTHLIVRFQPPTVNGTYGFLVGDGSGDFPEISYPFLPLETTALTADINGDGKADLYTVVPACINPPCGGNQDYTPQGQVTAMISFGNESFYVGGVAMLPAGLTGVQAVVGDFNKDGRPDLAVVGYATGSGSLTGELTVLLNQPDGSFIVKSYDLPATLNQNATLSNLVTGDFDGNGNLDLAFAFYSPANTSPWIYTFVGDGKGGFAAAKRAYILDSIFISNGHPLQAGDLNHDGRTDLVINLTAKSPAGNPRIASLLSKGSAGFYWASAVSVARPGATDIVVNDFNGDGKLDLAYISYLTSNNNAVGAVFAGNGAGAFTGPKVSLIPAITVGGSPMTTLTAMPFHTGQLPSLMISNQSNFLWELVNTTK